MANDSRVYATCVHAPVVDLGVLKEFEQIKENEIVRSSRLENLISELSNRFLLICIGEEDKRVDASRCFEFYSKLSAASDKIRPELFVLGGQTHGLTSFTEASYIAGASFLLDKISLRIKERLIQS